ncbi:MAG: TnsD family Tn7-like transposition protein [Eubacteriales bacterium]
MAANHYRQPVVEQYSLTRDYDTGAPVGTFSCACGFTYSRCGPDQKELDRYKIGRIKSFGPIWEKELIRLAVKENKGLRETSRQLNVDPKTIKNQLEKIKDHRDDHMTQALSVGDLTSELNKYRSRWLEIVENLFGKTKTGLRQLARAEYAWLYRHDRDWLNEHSPDPINRKKYADRRVNWIKRDEELAELVVMAAEEIRQLPGKPVCLTISSIGKRVGELALLQRQLAKLPKTKTILEAMIETVEDFQVRRVKYAADELHKRGELLRTWKIVRVAGLRPGYSKRVAEEIQNKIDTNILDRWRNE